MRRAATMTPPAKKSASVPMVTSFSLTSPNVSGTPRNIPKATATLTCGTNKKKKIKQLLILQLYICYSSTRQLRLDISSLVHLTNIKHKSD